jgi:hypothetical protein
LRIDHNDQIHFFTNAFSLTLLVISQPSPLLLLLGGTWLKDSAIIFVILRMPLF